MKFIRIILLFSVVVLFSSNINPAEQIFQEKDPIVYVCGSSKIYHKVKTHAALKRCKSGISEMKESAAQKQGKRVCKCRDK